MCISILVDFDRSPILHHEAHRPDGSPQPSRYSRHYYDMVMMADSPAKAAALADPQLLADVVDFKQRFYPTFRTKTARFQYFLTP